MNGSRALAAAACLSSCIWALLAAPRPAAASPADEAAQEVWSFVEKGMTSFAAMDRATFAATIADDLVAYDVDFEGKPIRMASGAEAIGYFDAMSAEAKKMGGTMTMSYRSHRCRATPGMGFCAVEMDFVVKLPDGSTISQPSFVSAVVEKTSSGWKWVHWHTSLSVVPAPATP